MKSKRRPSCFSSTETIAGGTLDGWSVVNAYNQYTQRTVSSQVDVMGVANPTTNVTVRVIGGTSFTAARKGEYYHHALTVGNNVYPQVEVKSLYGATQAQTNRVFNPPATETFTHDADGNLTQDGRWTYTWDGENRLIEKARDAPFASVRVLSCPAPLVLIVRCRKCRCSRCRRRSP